jgi:aspartate 1-decarboxylase
MLRHMLRSKIQNATVTEADLEYEGSITLDPLVIEAAGLLPGEMVLVVNLNNGDRLETYVLAGAPGSGVVCLNGPAARRGMVGDRLHVLAFGLVEESEARTLVPHFVALGPDNEILETRPWG